MLIKLGIFVLLTNLFLFILCYYLGLLRPIINIDYILLYLIVTLLPKCRAIKWLFLTLLMIIVCIELLLLVNQIFPFVKIGDIFYLSTFVFTGPVSYQKWFIFAVVYILFIVFITEKYFFTAKKVRSNKSTCMLFIIWCAIAAISMTAIRSQTVYFIKYYGQDLHKASGATSLLVANQYETVTKGIFFDLTHDTAPNNKVLLIVNESWGVATNNDIQEALLAPLYQNTNALDSISSGSFNFVGATVSGELRELCNKTAMVMDIKQVPTIEFTDCLPELLGKKGYETYSIHGADGNLYDRYRWYPLTGFQQSLFKEDLPKARNCKSFSGKCDYDLVEPIADIFATNDKAFVYWLTLNTHSPYDDTIFIDGFDCQKYDLKLDSEGCKNFKQQYQFFYRLSQYIADKRMKGVEVFIVGDHAPPIISLRDNFSVYDGLKVSWVKFKVQY